MIAAAQSTSSKPIRLAFTPTSNVETGSDSVRQPHPLEAFREAGIPVSLSSDDRVLLTGPAGTGKTAQVHELLEKLGDTPVLEIKLDENTRLEDLGIDRLPEQGFIVIIDGPLPPAEELLKAHESLASTPFEPHPDFKILFAMNPA